MSPSASNSPSGCCCGPSKNHRPYSLPGGSELSATSSATSEDDQYEWERRTVRRWSGDALEYGGQTLPTANTHRFQTVAAAAAVHFPEQGGQYPASGGSDGVSKRNAGAVD